MNKDNEGPEGAREPGQAVEKRKRTDRAKRKRTAEADTEATRIRRGGPTPPSRQMDEQNSPNTLHVVLESATDEQHEQRRTRWLLEATEALKTASNAATPSEHARWESEAQRLRGLAGSAVAHAHADAEYAGYTAQVQTICRNGRFYVCGTNPTTGDRLAWDAGIVKRGADGTRTKTKEL